MRAVRSRAPEVALLCAGLFYGLTFYAVQRAEHDVTPVALLVGRYVVAAAIAVPLALRRGWRTSGPAPFVVTEPRRWRNVMLAALVLSVLGFVGYLAQFVGLQYTSTSNSAFITGLYAVVVPVVEVFLYRRRPPTVVLGAIALSMVGLFFLTGASGGLGFGDVITLGAAITFGVWLGIAGIFGRRFPLFGLLGLEFCFGALIGIPLLFISGVGSITPVAIVLIILLGAGWVVFDSLVLWSQSRIEASRGGLLLLTEPLAASVLGYFIGERIGITGVVGAILMLSAIVLVELRPGNADTQEAPGGSRGEVAD
jgi:drug/metabolite transporter (DMT)-like permease